MNMNEIQSYKAPRELLPAPTNMVEAMALAKTLANSGMVPKAFDGKPEAVLVAMMWSHTLGIPTIQGLQYIAVINGKPSMYGDGLLAVVRASGLLQDIKEEVTQDKNGKLIATCTVSRKGSPTPTVSVFSQVDAETAGLWKKSGPWTQYPKRMLKMRARSFALRDAFPDVLAGMASAEEQEDVIDVVPTEKAEQKPKMPRRKTAAKPADVVEEAAPAIENNPSPSAAEVIPQPAAETQPEPVPVQSETVDEQTGEVYRTDETATAADLATADEWMSGAEMCANLGELMALFSSIPAKMLEEHPEVKEKFTECKMRLKDAKLS